MKTTLRLITSLIFFALGGISVQAAGTNFWAPTGCAIGGAGTWDTATAQWSPTSAGGGCAVWVNANSDSASFSGTASYVVVNNGTKSVNKIFGKITSQITINSSGTLAFKGTNPGVDVVSGGYVQLACPFSGTMTKTGAGRVDLNNSNTSGKFVITAGYCSIAAPNRLGTGTGSDLLTFDGGGLGSSSALNTFTTSQGITIKAGGAYFGASAAANVWQISSPIVGTNGGALQIASGSPFASPYATGCILLLENTNNSYNGPTIIPTGALELGASNVLPDTTILTLSGGDLEVFTNSDTIAKLVVTSANSAASTTGSGGKLTATNGYDLQASGTIAISLGGASAVTKTTAGVVDITGTNTYTGGTLLNGGTLRINSTTGLGAANSPVTFATGTTLSTSSTTARVLTYTWTVNGNITLGQNTTGTGTLTLAGAGGMNLGGATRVLTIANPADTISAVITNGGLTIDGGGTLTLSGANRYDGPTTINAGALTMSGANNLTGSITLNAGTLTMTGANVSTGPITITAGTMIVSGTNFCTGNTAVNGGELKTTTASAGGGSYTVADTATMSLAMTSASASLNVSSMTNGASTNNFDFARFGYPISRCISNAADLAVNGAVTVNVKGFDTNGTTTLIEYAGARSGAGNFVLGVVPPRVTASIDETITNKVILNTTASDTLIWVSDAVGNWDINNAGNKIWKLAAATTPAEYQENAVQGDTVRFDDTATNTTTVTVTVPVSPFNVTVDNTVTNYSFIGDGKISGTCSLTKNGTAELTITNANDFTGGTALNAGKLNIGNNAALGTGRLTINGGLIRSDSATARTLSVLTDLSGNLILGDAVNIGDITLSGASTIKGASRQVTVDTINATISGAIG